MITGPQFAALDTSVLRRLKPNSDPIRVAIDRAALSYPFGLPVSSFAEAAFGVHRLGVGARGYADLLRRLRWLQRHADRRTLIWLDLNPAAADVLGFLRATIPPPRGHDPVAWVQDLSTAAITWAAGYDIVTDNVRDFSLVAPHLPARSHPFNVVHPSGVGL